MSSQHAADRLARLFPRHAHKTVVAPLGCPLPVTPSPDPPSWLPLNQRPFFLYAGTFSDNKNQARLVQAWLELRKKHADFPDLVMTGNCETHYAREQVVSKLGEEPGRAHAFLPGVIPAADLAWCYRHALAYVHPSFAEGFGLPVLEAMSHGAPVACSNTTSLPEVGGDAARYFEPENVESIGKTLLWLWQDKKGRLELVEKGSQRWKAFSWQRRAQVIASAMEHVLREIH